MADPVTIKILTYLAAQAAADERGRRRLYAIILAPMIFVLVLAAFIVYLLSGPISLPAEQAFGWDELKAVETFRQDYGYNPDIGIHSRDAEEENVQEDAGRLTEAGSVDSDGSMRKRGRTVIEDKSGRTADRLCP